MKKIKHMTIDYTGLSTYRTCATKFNHLYVVRRTPLAASDPLVFGSTIHTALAEWHSGGIVGTESVCEANFKEFSEKGISDYVVPHDCARCRCIAAFVNAARETHLVDIPDNNMRSISHGMNILWHYTRVYISPTSQYEPIMNQHTLKPMVELKLTTKINDWLTYKGTMDMLARDVTDGSAVGIEHKTTYYLTEAFLNRARLNDQVTGYIHLLNENGYPDVDTVIWNALQTAHRKIVTDPDSCFARTKTRRTYQQIDEWKKNTITTAERIREDIERDYFNRSMPDACTMWNTMCSFADVCNAPQEMRPNMLTENYATNTWDGIIIEMEA